MIVLDNTGETTAPIVHHTKAHSQISIAVTSLHLSSIGCAAPNHAHTNHDRSAKLVAVFAQEINPHHKGDTASATSGAYHPALKAVL